jgi:hypothetical protein
MGLSEHTAARTAQPPTARTLGAPPSRRSSQSLGGDVLGWCTSVRGHAASPYGRAHSFADGHEEDGIGLLAFPPALYLAPCVRDALVCKADRVPRCQAGKAEFDCKAVMPTDPTPTLCVCLDGAISELPSTT